MFLYNLSAIFFLYISCHFFVECKTCEDGQIAFNRIEFQICRYGLRDRYLYNAEYNGPNGTICNYSQALIDECFHHYEKCYSGESLTELKKFWLRKSAGVAFLYDKHLVASACDAFKTVFSEDELEVIQLEIPKIDLTDKKCEYNLDFDALIRPEFNGLDKVMSCQNICSNETVMKNVKDEFDSCKPNLGKVRDDLRDEAINNRYRLTCGKFIKFANVCSTILDECLSSVWQELIIGEHSYVMYLGVLDGLDDDDSFKIEDCAYFGGYISEGTLLESPGYLVSGILLFKLLKLL